jgi:hypothetical protein
MDNRPGLSARECQYLARSRSKRRAEHFRSRPRDSDISFRYCKRVIGLYFVVADSAFDPRMRQRELDGPQITCRR